MLEFFCITSRSDFEVHYEESKMRLMLPTVEDFRLSTVFRFKLREKYLNVKVCFCEHSTVWCRTGAAAYVLFLGQKMVWSYPQGTTSLRWFGWGSHHVVVWSHRFPTKVLHAWISLSTVTIWYYQNSAWYNLAELERKCCLLCSLC